MIRNPFDFLFLGLPENPNTFEFETVCNRSQMMKPHPVTLLTALLKNEEAVSSLVFFLVKLRILKR